MIEEHVPTPWERIERVIDASGLTTNGFARHVGLPRGENLYQIKRGNNGISRDLAERVNRHYPQFSLLWLLTGRGTPGQQDSGVLTLPLYADLREAVYPAGSACTHLTLSAQVACGAEAAVRSGGEAFGPLLRNPILLLRAYREDEEPLYGNLHGVVTEHYALVRTLCRDADPSNVRLRRPQATDDEDLVIQRARIRFLWLVVAAIGSMIR